MSNKPLRADPLTLAALEDFVVETMGITRADVRSFEVTDAGEVVVKELNRRRHTIDQAAFENWRDKR